MPDAKYDDNELAVLMARFDTIRKKLADIGFGEECATSSSFCAPRNDSTNLIGGFDWPDRFMTMDNLDSCSAFHDAGHMAEYVYDEVISAGCRDLEEALEVVVQYTRDSTLPVQDATFSRCFDLLMDITRSSISPRSVTPGTPKSVKWSGPESLARMFLIQSVASRRPSVKLKRMQDAIQALTESNGDLSSTAADELLDTLTRILPTVPQIRETVILLRTYVDAMDDPSILLGPIGYSLTSIEAVSGTL
jgi:hypothetical protein